MSTPRQDFDHIADALDVASSESSEYRSALVAMEELAEAGSVEAAEAVAEIFAFAGPHYQPGKAYHWYYIALSAQGYSTGFDDRNDMPPYYCGPEGDFRNEAQVNSLVVEIGFTRVHALDRVAEAWLHRHRGA
jgi:hypothetical protein